MLFDNFLLVVESRDLSQTDIILKIGSLVKLSSLVNELYVFLKNFSFTQAQLSAKWILSMPSDCQFYWSKRSKHLSQLFWREVNLRGTREFILQKVRASVVERQTKKFCYWSIIKCSVHVPLPKRPINQFEPVQQRRQQG